MENDIAHSLAIKEGNLFFLSAPDGSVALAPGHGFGLYYKDCRFLSGYELRIGGRKPKLRTSNANPGNAASVLLSNAELQIDGQLLPAHSVEISVVLGISGHNLTLSDAIKIRNLTSKFLRLPLEFIFQSRFEDIFTIRGMAQRKRGILQPPQWKDEALYFSYAGADAIDRELVIRFSPAPTESSQTAVNYEIELAERSSQEISISMRVSAPNEQNRSQPRRLVRALRASVTENIAGIHTDNAILNRILDRSFRDLEMLRSDIGGTNYFAAGVPWYVALFGRDSIITALQMLAYDAAISEQTIRLLAGYQGQEIDPWRDEEPGKILHELRVGEMAHLNEIPHTPYYGTIDATPLWLILVARHAAWTGDLRVFHELQPNIDAALNWIAQHGDFNRDGYVEYQCKSESGLANQGWKDSAEAIVNADGSLGSPPIALVEVQGYVYRAKNEIASLFRRIGNEKRAATLESEAQSLRKKFNRDFWVDEGYYALALQEGRRRAAVLSSNCGHALWSGIAGNERASKIVEHLLSPEMFSGWGIRTLSRKAARYDPLGYHLGTVWPHDNSLIAAGFKRYGFDEAALRVFDAMVDAAKHFDAYRLPELFGGFAREDDVDPVPYPIACQPQAWAAGAIPFCLTTLLGLEPDGFEDRLRIVNPVLPSNVERVEIRKLRVGTASADLLFERTRNAIATRVQKVQGDLQITIE